MRLSRFTIAATVPGRDTTVLVQPLTGEAALIANAQAEALLRTPLTALPSGLDEDELRDCGFVVDADADDQRLLAHAFTEYSEEAARTPTQLIVVPGFGCNLSCTYCYQEPFEPTRGLVQPAVIDAFFAWVDTFHANDDPKPYVTLFGGEPLVDTPAHRDRVQRYLDGVRARGMDLAVVTNGYDLERYMDLLATGPVREVQVTLDGPPAIHDQRRPRAGGGATFDRIVRGVDALVAAKIPVNLRVVVDRANLPALPELARIAEDKGWLALPAERFKTQVGRNYELFGCAASQKRSDLFERAELWAAYVELSEREPVLRRFHRPRFHGMAHLADTGELPAPNFDACPAAKKEWAFAPDGSLYGCTATVGNPAYRLGTFYPTIERDDAAIGAWRSRSTRTIPQCATCDVAPLCGGGCGALAAAKTGDPLSPDCRPVRELIGLGARFYGLDKLEDAPPAPRFTPTKRKLFQRADGERPRMPMATVKAPTPARTGCLACGADLVYSDTATPMACSGCGATHPSNARCTRGHFFCDRCHAGSAVDAIAAICLASDETNPVALAARAMAHPKVNMHGPEHHFLSPAVLLTAWCNVTGQQARKADLLAEARRRSEPVLGGFCGFQGACGAAIGTGIFVSLITGATPTGGAGRGLANRMTSAALKAVGGTDAARCCKRDVFLSLLSAATFCRTHLDIHIPAAPVPCAFSTQNRECTQKACPFYEKDGT